MRTSILVTGLSVAFLGCASPETTTADALTAAQQSHDVESTVAALESAGWRFEGWDTAYVEPHKEGDLAVLSFTNPTLGESASLIYSDNSEENGFTALHLFDDTAYEAFSSKVAEMHEVEVLRALHEPTSTSEAGDSEDRVATRTYNLGGNNVCEPWSCAYVEYIGINYGCVNLRSNPLGRYERTRIRAGDRNNGSAWYRDARTGGAVMCPNPTLRSSTSVRCTNGA